jgi:hypothetical protein
MQKEFQSTLAEICSHKSQYVSLDDIQETERTVNPSQFNRTLPRIRRDWEMATAELTRGYLSVGAGTQWSTQPQNADHNGQTRQQMEIVHRQWQLVAVWSLKASWFFEKRHNSNGNHNCSLQDPDSRARGI